MNRITMFLVLIPLWAAAQSNVAPGARMQMLAHNAYPDHGQYADRLDRAMANGVPFVVEEDLAWIDGKSLLIHGSKNASADDPTLETYFFPKVKPLMEKALASGDKSHWPLVTLYLDIKNDPPEHLEAIAAELDQYKAWLTTAKKTKDITKLSSLKLGPLMVLVEDKYNDTNKLAVFYDRVPVGGDIRVFGSVTKPAENPQKLPKQDWVNSLSSVPLEQLTTQKADNYRRWWGIDWAYVEHGGQENHGDWGSAQQARLDSIVTYGHRLGYLISVYCLDGYAAADNQGWDHGYNFGSKDVAQVRWKAAMQAHADFISTDQYEDVAKLIRSAFASR